MTKMKQKVGGMFLMVVWMTVASPLWAADGEFVVNAKSVTSATIGWWRFAQSPAVTGGNNAGVFDIRWTGGHARISIGAKDNDENTLGMVLNDTSGITTGSTTGVTQIRLLEGASGAVMYLEANVASAMAVDFVHEAGYGWTLISPIVGSSTGFTAHTMDTTVTFAVNEDSKMFKVGRDGAVTLPLSPALDMHAATKKYVDDRQLTTVAQTITGAKTFSSAPTFSTFTPGSVLFAGTGGLLSQNNTNLFWDNVNNWLGIGTPVPKGTLSIGSSNFRLDKSDASPNAGYIRFGDNTGWKFHLGRSQEFVGSSYNTGTTGTLMTVQDNGNVGIGTTAPGATLDIRGNSFRDSNYTATKIFRLSSFYHNETVTPNEKVDLYMPDTTTQTFWGYIDVIITDFYNYQNAAGGITKRFYLGINPNNTVYTNESRYTDEGGVTADNWAISDLRWDSVNNRYYITIAHRTGNSNIPVVIMKASARETNFIANFLTFTNGPSYTTDTTVYGRPYVTFNNNVGIGTTAPSQKLEVTGRVAIAPTGTAVDNAYNGNLVITKPVASGQYINLIRSGQYPWSIGTVYNSSNFAIGTGVVGDSTFTTPAFVISTSGNVGIGTTAPAYKLDVAGDIRTTTRFLVNAQPLNVPDYVFDSTYPLMPLNEVRAYIEKEKHLPNLPSADEIKKQGDIDLGAFQMKLLEKVEEMTLYLLAQQETLNAQQAKINALENQLQQLIQDQ